MCRKFNIIVDLKFTGILIRKDKDMLRKSTSLSFLLTNKML